MDDGMVTWRVIGDDSGHKYLIEEARSDEFRAWVRSMEGDDEADKYDGFDFGDMMFNGPIEFSLPSDMRLIMNKKTGEFGFLPNSSPLVRMLETP